MTVDPIRPEDYYKIELHNQQVYDKILGGEYMKFTDNSKDVERIKV